MIKLLMVSNIDENMKQEFNLAKGDNLYGCYLDNTIIGYTIVRVKETDRVYLMILDKYQNKGYGTEAFKEVLSIINEKINCVVPLDNIKMQRIVLTCNGEETGRDGKNIHYIV